MNIKPCPHCAEYNHFDAKPRRARCWHCGAVTDFAKVRTFEEKLGALLSAKMQTLL
jgi:hypothetical protein